MLAGCVVYFAVQFVSSGMTKARIRSNSFGGKQPHLLWQSTTFDGGRTGGGHLFDGTTGLCQARGIAVARGRGRAFRISAGSEGEKKGRPKDPNS